MKQSRSILFLALTLSFFLFSCEKENIEANIQENTEESIEDPSSTKGQNDNVTGIDRINVAFLNSSGGAGSDLVQCWFSIGTLEVIDCYGNVYSLSYEPSAIPLEPSSTVTFQTGSIQNIQPLELCAYLGGPVHIRLTIPSLCPAPNDFYHYPIATGLIERDSKRGKPFLIDLTPSQVNPIPSCSLKELPPC